MGIEWPLDASRFFRPRIGPVCPCGMRKCLNEYDGKSGHKKAGSGDQRDVTAGIEKGRFASSRPQGIPVRLAHGDNHAKPRYPVAKP